jgi:hypothetical protein
MSPFRADCSNCCGLCCVVPNFLAVQGFRVDKAAETPCTHLNNVGRCSIHATRETHGYPACKGFDCFGVGQWITQFLYGGASWTDSDQLAREMFDAYRHWLPRFEAAALLETALPYVRAEARAQILDRMKALTTTDPTSVTVPTDSRQLRRETIATIRSALKIDATNNSKSDAQRAID